MLFFFCLLGTMSLSQAQKIDLQSFVGKDKVGELLTSAQDAKFKTETGFYIVTEIEKTEQTITDKSQKLTVLDAQGNLISSIQANHKVLIKGEKTAYNYVTSQLLERNGKIQLVVYKGQHNYLPTIDEGIATTYILMPTGKWQLVKELAYRDKIIPN